MKIVNRFKGRDVMTVCAIGWSHHLSYGIALMHLNRRMTNCGLQGAMEDIEENAT